MRVGDVVSITDASGIICISEGSNYFNSGNFVTYGSTAHKGKKRYYEIVAIDPLADFHSFYHDIVMEDRTTGDRFIHSSKRVSKVTVCPHCNHYISMEDKPI